uniref:Uncharacterized protein n=1 Tax=Cucumis melo TaxID=3656 RepID=A0A9I9EJT3_CUCME
MRIVLDLENDIGKLAGIEAVGTEGGFVDGEGSAGGEDEKKEEENWRLTVEFPIGRRVRLSNGPDIKLCKKEILVVDLAVIDQNLLEIDQEKRI